MSWNYRVMEFEDEVGGKYYEIKEVYYNRDGSLMGYCDASVSGGSFSDIISTLDMMKTDAHKAVLKPSDFEGEQDDESTEMDETKVTSTTTSTKMDETEDPLCKICGKVLGSTKECAWTGCPLNWGDEASEKRQDIIGQNGNVGYGEE